MHEPQVEVDIVSGHGLRDALSLLEGFVREGEMLSPEELRRISLHVESGTFVVVAAAYEGRFVGVATVSFRPSVSLGGDIASIEDLYVVEEMRRRGTGREMLRKVEEVCRGRCVFYVEVQVEERSAVEFYSAAGFESGEVRVMSVSYPFSSGEGNSITS